MVKADSDSVQTACLCRLVLALVVVISTVSSYSRPSLARTIMACLPRLFGTHS